MLETQPGKTRVFFCAHCGHLLTPHQVDLVTYYAQHYKVLNNTDEEDQLYDLVGNKPVFRLEHQANVLLAKLQLSHRARILDYGCAKGATLKRVCAARPDVEAHLFDVTDSYIPFWQTFVPPERWATHTPKSEWVGFFDVITSFFALEHVANPRAMLAAIAQMLRPNGLCYCIVPNVYTNIADFVVADHVNHFSTESLRYLFSAIGFQIVEIDETSHNSAFVVTAKHTGLPCAPSASPQSLRDLPERVMKIADFWQSFGRRVQDFEKAHSREPAAIYGAGFYGNFIAACLEDRQQIQCFVDRDPYRQGKHLWQKPIVDPDQLPASVHSIYVGLNPARARSEIQKVAGWGNRSLSFFYS
jgi:2-polyprenyl-3-methyl-5-hydroxy-6-metoxy-1,4-benzoquinol methylase